VKHLEVLQRNLLHRLGFKVRSALSIEQIQMGIRKLAQVIYACLRSLPNSCLKMRAKVLRESPVRSLISFRTKYFPQILFATTRSPGLIRILASPAPTQMMPSSSARSKDLMQLVKVKNILNCGNNCSILTGDYWIKTEH
jgi:hypothetical protein